MIFKKHVFLGLFFLLVSVLSAQYVTDPLPYASIANPLPDTMSQVRRDSVNLKIGKIRVNQAGYRVGDEKLFYTVGLAASDFSVINCSTNSPVATGTLTSTGGTTSGAIKAVCYYKAQLVTGGAVKYSMEGSAVGGEIKKGYIPELPEGTYKIVAGSEESVPFVIGNGVYSMVKDALLKYYGIARCGKNESWFHKDCHLKDDVVGGWHDAGDHIKIAQSMGYAISVLALSAAALKDRDTDKYAKNQAITQRPDGWPDALREATVGADYALAVYKAANNSVASMKLDYGTFGFDHSWWGRPEFQDMVPTQRGGPVRESTPGLGGNTCGSFAAGLAMISKLTEQYDPAYSAQCIQVAKDLYAYGKVNQKAAYNAAMSGGGMTYDELAFAAMALWWATKDTTYRYDLLYSKITGDKANGATFPKGGFMGGWFAHDNPGPQKGFANTNWDNLEVYALWGLYRLILKDEATASSYGLSSSERLNAIEDVVFSLINDIGDISSTGSESVTLPVSSMTWKSSTLKCDPLWGWMRIELGSTWMPNRYQAGNITELFCYYDIASQIQGMALPGTPASTDWKAKEVKAILLKQLNFMFGMNPWDVSMIVGVGAKNFNHHHHRASNPELQNVPGAFYKYVPPVGALSGGYDPNTTAGGQYVDLMGGNNGYYHSEISLDATTAMFLPVMGLAKEEPVVPPDASVRIVYVGSTEAIIEIRQTKLGTATIRYGEGATPDKSASGTTTDVFHQIKLTGLKNGTTYKFDVEVKDLFGNTNVIMNINEESQKVYFTFTTLQNLLEDAQIVNVKICRVTHDSAEIFWYTPNGDFDSKIFYGESKPPLTLQDKDVAGHPVKFHYVKIGGLKEKTKYYFYVQSGNTRNDNNGAMYEFTTGVEHVNFDIRAVRYEWGGMPSIGMNIVNQDIKQYDSLDVRIYFRAKDDPATNYTFENDLGARMDIGIVYDAAGFQKEFTENTDIRKNIMFQKPVKMPDTYNPADGTYAYYLSIPLWGVMMKSGSRIRLDIILDRRSPFPPYQDLMNQAPKHVISDNDWSFGPHSRAKGDPVDFGGIQTISKADVDENYWSREINNYMTVYRKGEFVWGYSPSKAEQSTKKTYYEMTSQITSPINNPSADYYLYEGSGKTINVKGYAKVTPEDARIKEIWINGVVLANPKSVTTWNEAERYYDLNIPITVKNGRNLVDITLFAGPGEEFDSCYGCASTNHSFFIEAPFLQQFPSQLSVKDINLNSISDTVKIDTTVFHVIVTDKNGNKNKRVKDTLSVTITNLNNGDMSLVKLIETADSSNVFQTLTTIAVVSLPAAQTGNDKISMSSAEQILIRYVDPSDESDTSKVVLYSRADFPVPVGGWIKDTDGNGSIDQLVVLFNQAVKELPDSIQFAIPNAGSQRVVKNNTDQFAITNGNKVTITIKTPVEKTTGFSIGLTGIGKSFLMNKNQIKSTQFTIRDSAGPVLINSAVLHEREGSGDDTLTVTFSETVSSGKLTGNVLLLRKGGTTTSLNVLAIKGMEPGTNTLTLIVRSSRAIAEGDSVMIDPSGVLDDLSGNKAHAQNKPVVIVVKAAPPQIINAWYFDSNADGKLDRINIELSKPVTPSECDFTIVWKTDDNKKTVGGNKASISAENPKVLQVLIEGLVTGQDEIVTGGIMRLKISNQRFGETPFQMVFDSAAPVIVSALFQKSLQEHADTLKLVFSEPVQPIPNDAFLLYSIEERLRYGYVCKENSTTNLSNRMFIVTDVQGVKNSGKGDSIWINPTIDVIDMSNNIQRNPLNRRALLKIGKLPLEIKIYSGPNPFTPEVSSILDDEDVPEQIRGKKGYLIRLGMSTGNSGGSMVADIKSKVQIVDGVGNVIFTGDLTKGRRSGSTSYYLHWSGNNKQNRLVGTGTYMVYLTTETLQEDGEDGDTQKRVDTFKVGVKRKVK